MSVDYVPIEFEWTVTLTNQQKKKNYITSHLRICNGVHKHTITSTPTANKILNFHTLYTSWLVERLFSWIFTTFERSNSFSHTFWYLVRLLTGDTQIIKINITEPVWFDKNKKIISYQKKQCFAFCNEAYHYVQIIF